MNPVRLFAFLALAVLPLVALAGCSAGENAAGPTDPNVHLSASEKIEKIENDPKIPDGLKKIQTETLRAGPDAKR